MSDLVVNLWARYGKRRLYVNLPDGRRVGWVDLVTEERHLELLELAVEFELVLRPHMAEAKPVGGGDVTEAPGWVPETTFTPPAAPKSVPQNLDLSLHRPGELAQARAQAEWEAAKEKSVLGAWGRRLLDANTDERSWRVGAQGEEAVGGKLEKLVKRGWRVLHSVPVGTRGSDIDHVLIGPGGVFTMNTKRHPQSSIWVRGDTVKVNGHNQPYVRNSRHEAERAGRLLSEATGRPVPVTGALVFLTGTLPPKVTVKESPVGTLILDLETLVPAFRRRKNVWSPDEVNAIYEVARWSSTWAPVNDKSGGRTRA